MNQRNLPIPRENVGTLHALCYRDMGHYEIAEKKAQEFNEEYPQYAISTSGSNNLMDEMAVDAHFQTEGDRFFAAYNLHRSKGLALSTTIMPTNLINWVRHWERWKSKNNYIDFTDMITYTLQGKSELPGNPKVGFFDESQDFSKCQFDLIRHWAKSMDHIVMVGDPDQTIYNFSGADPEAFLGTAIPEENKRILKQSWRLPKKVHEFSQTWIKQIKNREPKEFNPREEEGSVTRIQATYKTPNRAVELAARYAQDGKTVMLLATCGYHLNAIKMQLREAGLPYHNKYRASRGDWNPLGSFHKGGKGKVSTRERILSFLNDASGMFWTAQDLAKWIELIKIRGVLKKGAKDRIQTVIDDQQGVIYGDESEFYQEIFEDFALQKAMQRDIPWFKENLLSAKRSVVEYPLSVFQKHGKKVLEEEPRITIGTIHSVKGGQSDCVILFPDLSLGAMDEYQRNKDSVIRTFYVGMTRAKESLVICQPSSQMSVKI